MKQKNWFKGNTEKLFISFIILLISSVGSSQVIPPLHKGIVQRIVVHGKGLEGNLEGDPADRNVSVYLPASYGNTPGRHYPVVYFLHGFTDNDAQWYGLTKHWINLPKILDTAFSEDSSHEMIFVTPDAYTRYQGSFYGNSATTGNWEDFIAKELVSCIDSHYRTIPKAESRGLAGHSMGGFGTMRIGQKYPEIFSCIYMLSPGAIKMYGPFNPKNAVKWEAIKTMEDFEKTDFGTKAMFAVAAAWSPNPDKPPFYLDLPVMNGENQLNIQAKWIANSPFAALDQYIPNYKRLHAIGFDAGDKDKSIASDITLLHHELDKYGIRHSFEVYDGDHTNHIGLRIKQYMTPFFSANLAFDKKMNK